jgi:hypothetical protein
VHGKPLQQKEQDAKNAVRQSVFSIVKRAGCTARSGSRTHIFTNMRRILIISLIVLAICLQSNFRAGAATQQELANNAEELLNNGEDITNPVNRFDARFQFRTLPDATQSGQLFDNRQAETMTFRTDLVFFKKPDQLALRFDLPLIWSNKPTSGNTNGVTQFGLGDLLLQQIYVHTFNARWAAGAGFQEIVPTATLAASGDGKWEIAPTVGARAELPEISAGSFALFDVRDFVTVAGRSSRSNVNFLSLEPQLSIGLPGQWFLTSYPKIRYNFENNKWFVPLDIMVGKKFGVHWVASIEYQYGLVTDDYRYKQWLEARVGYFF